MLQIDPAKRTARLLLCGFGAASRSEVIFLAGVWLDRPVTGAEFVAKIAPAAQAWILLTDTHTHTHTHTHTERHSQTHTHTERERETHTQRQTHTDTHRQTHTHTHTHDDDDDDDDFYFGSLRAPHCTTTK